MKSNKRPLLRFFAILTSTVFLASCVTRPKLDDRYFWSSAVFDSIKNSLSHRITGQDYTHYQARRLNLKPGERFDYFASRGPIYLCGEQGDSTKWLQHRCVLVNVVEANSSCAAIGRAMPCGVAFQMAPFVLQDPSLVEAFKDGVARLGHYSPTSSALESEFGVENLHAPGMSMNARTDERVRNSIFRAGVRPYLHDSPDGTFLMTFE